MNDSSQDNASPTQPQRIGMRSAIIGQCFGELSFQVIEAGVMLLYLKGLGLSSAKVLLFLSVPWVASAIGVLPSAIIGDRIGKKRVGFTGLTLNTIGFVVLSVAGFFAAAWVQWIVLAGIILYGLGTAMMESTWFALLSPVVPEPMRGRFFGLLRVSWRSVGVVFVGLSGFVLSEDAPTLTYQGVLAFVACMMVVRLWFYSRIPELEREPPRTKNLRQLIVDILRVPGFSSFCAYIFLLHLAVFGGPLVFNLIEKDALGFGDNQIAWMGAAFMIGSMPGFWLGGKLVDRYTTKPVFLGCHFAFGVVYLTFIARDMVPLPLPMILGLLHFAYGFTVSASSVAISTETLALIPPQNKSVSTSLVRLLQRVGSAMSGVVAAWMLDVGMLNEQWQWWDLSMTQYDSILILWALMIVVLVVTLGLVPSVIGKAQWMPRSG